MAAVTDRVRFLTNVVKLPIRDPLLVAKQLSSMAVLSNERVGLGVGLSWMPEEFAWTHTDMKTRGKRADEMIEILRLVCGGGGPQWVEYHGKYYDFDRLMISPAPERPCRSRSAACPSRRCGAPRASATGGSRCRTPRPTSPSAIVDAQPLPGRVRARRVPFEINALCIDAFDLDGYRRLADAGVTELQAVPWYFYGGDPNDLQVQLDSLARFADEVIARF